MLPPDVTHIKFFIRISPLSLAPMGDIFPGIICPYKSRIAEEESTGRATINVEMEKYDTPRKPKIREAQPPTGRK